MNHIEMLIFSTQAINFNLMPHCLKLPSHIPRDLTASLLRPCYDQGRSTVAMDAAGTQRGHSEDPKDAQGRRTSATILNMHKTVAEKQRK